MTKVMNLVDLSRYAEECAGRFFSCVLDDGQCVTVSVGFTSFDVCINTRVVTFYGNSATLAIGSVKSASLTQKEGGVIWYLSIWTDFEKDGEYLFIII